MMTPSAQSNCRQPRQGSVLAGLARWVLLACLLVSVLIGPVETVTPSQDDHPGAIAAKLADTAPQPPAHCDPGPVCAAFLVPVIVSTSQITRVFGVVVRARDSFLRPFGGPAIDLPPPRRFA